MGSAQCTKVTAPMDGSAWSGTRRYVKDPARKRPLERMRELEIPARHEAHDRICECSDSTEGPVLEALAREDAEPDLDLVQPAPVERREDERNAVVLLQPRLRVGSSSRVDVVCDDDDPAARVDYRSTHPPRPSCAFDSSGEARNRTTGWGGPILSAGNASPFLRRNLGSPIATFGTGH